MAAQDEINERFLQGLSKLEGRIEKAEAYIHATDRDRPGLAMRTDRLERQFSALMRTISWIGGGGLLGLIGTLLMLYKLLEALSLMGQS